MELDLETLRREAEREVADRMAALTGTVATITRLRDEAAALTASAASRDGLVEVWVNAAGVVIRTDLHDDVCRAYRPAELATEVTEVAQAAARRVGSLVEKKLAGITAFSRSRNAVDDGVFATATSAVPTAPARLSTDPPDAESRRRVSHDRGAPGSFETDRVGGGVRRG